MKWKKTGLTLVEILIVLGIISLFVGLLLPALNVAKETAKEAKQKAQFTAIEVALMTFKNDYGDYPPSDGWDYTSDTSLDYCGAQKLAEALLGWDLMGFHPKSAWRADGFDINGGNATYDPQRLINPLIVRDDDNDGVPDTLRERKSLYLDLGSTNAFRTSGLEGLFFNNENLHPDRFVLCDIYYRKKVRVINQITDETTTHKAGTPILYFKANTSSKQLGPPERSSIYKIGDNRELIRLGTVEDAEIDIQTHPLYQPDHFSKFYENIMDPKVSTTQNLWPYRPDSYILISAGADGLYGTGDDIRNFGN